MEQKALSIKSRARLSLKGKWTSAIAAVAVAFLCLLIESMFAQFLQYVFFKNLEQAFGYINLITLCLDFFAFSPLYLGMLRWFWQITGGVDEPVSSFFYYYENRTNFFRSIKVALSLWWRLILVMAVALLPYVFIKSYALSVLSLGEEFLLIYTTLNIIAIVLAVLGVVLAIAFLTRFYLAIPILFCYENISVSNTFKLSVRLTKRKRTAAFSYLVLGFAGWLLLSIFIIPLIYTVPFFLATFFTYGREKIDLFISESLPKNP